MPDAKTAGLGFVRVGVIREAVFHAPGWGTEVVLVPSPFEMLRANGCGCLQAFTQVPLMRVARQAG